MTTSVEPEHLLRNLLAVIHRDGGHYAADHGLKKAAEDAEAIVCHERAGMNVAASLLREVTGHIAGQLGERIEACLEAKFDTERCKCGHESCQHSEDEGCLAEVAMDVLCSCKKFGKAEYRVSVGDERELFEKWAIGKGYPTHGLVGGKFASELTEELWGVWQARARISVGDLGKKGG